MKIRRLVRSFSSLGAFAWASLSWLASPLDAHPLDNWSLSPFAPWVEELARRGVTGGCAPGLYCPTSPVTRDQMAVFLLKTLEGPAYTPPACSAAPFGDVPATSPFCPWVQELVARAITGGCGGGNYCPLNPVTRGQMAVFLVTTFGLVFP